MLFRSNGAEIWGGMHQTRILVDNFENSVFAFKFTRGSGKYSGFNSEFSMKDTQTWTPGPPMQEEKPTDGGDNPGPDPGTGSVIERLPGLIRAAFSRADDGGGASMPPITLKQKRTPIVDVTSMGLLAPTNEGSKVAVNAAAGSSCSGSLVAGKNRIVLPKKTVSAKGGSAVLKVLTGEELAAADEWTLTVTCTLKGKSSKYSKTVKTFEALPYTKGSGG